LLRTLQLIAVGLNIAIASMVETTISRADTAANSGDALEEIVVTAQKKQENEQNVGISITALSSQDIVNLGIVDTTDVARVAPSVQFNKLSESYIVFNIRGVAQNDYGDQQEPPVAIYEDDSYASTLNLEGFPVFDTQQIEVLRGPQGTLFGRNATGGAVQFISNKPTKEFESEVSVTAGNFNELDYSANISGPLSDAIQGRFAINRVYHDGYLINTVPDAGDRGGVDQLAARGELAFQPTDALSGLFTIRFSHDGPDSDGGLYSTIPSYVQPLTGTGNYLTAASANPNPWGTCVGCDASGYRNDAINPYLGGNAWTVHDFGTTRNDRTITGASLHLDANLGSVALVSASDFQHMDKNYVESEWGNNGLAGLSYQAESNLTQFTQELRASGTAAQQSWVAGAYFMRVTGAYSGYFDLPYVGYDANGEFTQDTTSVAVFGQNDWQISDGWKLIGGLRYWHDIRTLDYSVYDNTGNYPESDPITFNKNTNPDLANPSFQNYNAKLELDRQFTPDLLTYLSFNRGTKSGGFEASLATPAGGLRQAYTQSIPYGTERLNAYELGTKSTWLANTLRINGDVFYYDYAGFQGYEQVGLLETIKNLNAHEWGAELEVESRPVSGLTLSTGLSTLHSTVNDITLPSLLVVDSPLPQTPKFSGNVLARYEHRVPGGEASAQLTGRYWTGYCWTLFCGPLDQEHPGFASDARIGYDIGVAFFAVGVTNLTNRTYRMYEGDYSSLGGFTAAVYAPPRWYTASVTVKFGAAAH
jgi:iron complex outermembrane receptor protein